MMAVHSQRKEAPMQWRLDSAIWAVALNSAGFVVITLGWFTASGTARLSDQYTSTTMAIVGLLLAGFGNGVWLLSGRRAVGVRRRRLLPRQPRVHNQEHFGSEPEPAPPIDGTISKNGDVVTGAGMTQYHRPDCMLVRTKNVRAFHPQGDGNERLSPCRICRP